MATNLGEAEVTRESPKAIRVDLESGEEGVWVPKSVIDDDSEVYETGTSGDLIVSDWWAQKNKLG